MVLLVVFHQCVKPPEETRRYVAIPRSSVSKLSVMPLLDCTHGLPAGRLATSNSGSGFKFAVGLGVGAGVGAGVDGVTTAFNFGVRYEVAEVGYTIPVARSMVAVTADALSSSLDVGFL